jgi:hypothetical protein
MPNRAPQRFPPSRAWVIAALVWAWLILLAGCGASLLTVASGDYNGVLLTAVSCAAIAAVLLTFAGLRGHIVARIFAALGLVPISFIVGEFLLRYH